MRKIESIAALDAEEVTIDSALVAVISADDFRTCIAAPYAESRFATVAAVRADRANVIHLPRTRLVTIGSRSQSADRTNVDTHSAFFAVEMIFLIGSDDRANAAVLHAKRPNIHPFAADAHAAIAKDATRTVEIHHGRPLLFLFVVLGLHEFRLSRAVRERHVLQFAFAASIADGQSKGWLPNSNSTIPLRA